ncbi:MAG: protein kinase [Gemmatimonadetes bacterium]|nr:protein kinase [Gemmatimonadota bacterium]
MNSAIVAAGGVMASTLAVYAELRRRRRWQRAIDEITTAARDAARGRPRSAITLTERGPLAELAAAVAALIDRSAQVPSLSDDDLARVATTRRPATARGNEGGDDSSLTAGQLFADRYEIIELLGRSDVRSAYKVRDRELGELVLLKTLGAGAFAGDSGGVAQFKSDLRIVRRLAHRNILRTYDFGEWSVYYVTMELVEAIPLNELLSLQGRLGVAATMAIAAQASRALTVAHREGVLHRDIRPQSLLLDSRGLLKVADFGLAATAHRIRSLAHSANDPEAISYVPPEVLRAGTVDVRSDLYSLAVVLYQCVAGRLPSPLPEPLSSIDPAVPQSFSDLIAQTLSASPDTRPSDADQFRRMLALEPAATQ